MTHPHRPSDAALLASPALATLVRLALEEDAVREDVTTRALVPAQREAIGKLRAKAPGVIAGLFLLWPESPLIRAFPSVRAECFASDGDLVHPDQVLAIASGYANELLGLERTLLNFVQRMSGIATTTRTYVDAVSGSAARIQETRKTCPGHRDLDKYAVAVGGGLNHRASLADMILIKENHVALSGLGAGPAGIAKAVERARSRQTRGIAIEIEVETLPEFESALKAAPDVIMLDDFSTEDIRAAVLRRNQGGRSPLLEVSGGVTFDRVTSLAALGVDRISVGALTHSVRALDLSFKIHAASNP